MKQFDNGYDTVLDFTFLVEIIIILNKAKSCKYPRTIVGYFISVLIFYQMKVILLLEMPFIVTLQLTEGTIRCKLGIHIKLESVFVKKK